MFKIIVKFQSAKPFHRLHKKKKMLYTWTSFTSLLHMLSYEQGFKSYYPQKENFFSFLSYTICHIKEKINKLKDLKKKNPISKLYAQFSPTKKYIHTNTSIYV